MLFLNLSATGQFFRFPSTATMILEAHVEIEPPSAHVSECTFSISDGHAVQAGNKRLCESTDFGGCLLLQHDVLQKETLSLLK